MSFMPPILASCANCLRKSSSVKLPLASFSCCFSISSSAELRLDAAATFSIRPIMSPWPRMRWAMRSGWNSSSRSSFSPTPMNLIGTLVTSLIDRAAPPRASPSSLVRMTPLRSRASLNALALLTASWPVMASQTRKTSSGLHEPVDLLQLVHRHLGDVQPAGGVEDDGVEQRACLAWATALRQTSPDRALAVAALRCRPGR